VRQVAASQQTAQLVGDEAGQRTAGLLDALDKRR
jgi:hypothetical protein